MTSPDASANVLRIDNLRISRGGQVLLEDVNISLSSGEVACVMGPSGSGKTTLAHAVVGDIGSTLQVTGDIQVAGQSIRSMSTSQLRAHRAGVVSLMPQDVSGCLDPLWRPRSLMFEAMRAHAKVSRRQARRRSLQVLEAVGLSGPRGVIDARIYQLSVGMQRRVALALALINEPRLLVVDEPTASLDGLARYDVVQMLLAARQSTNTAMLVMTHDPMVAAALADQRWSIAGAKLVPGDLTSGVAASPPPLMPPARPQPAAGEVLVELRKASKRFGRLSALEDFDLAVTAGEVVGLVGQSGSGKTTAAKMLAGLLSTSSGSRDLNVNPADVQMVVQDPYSCLDPHLQVGAIVAEPLKARRLWKELGWARVVETLDLVGLDETYLHRYPHQLSGGQRQRVNLARSLATRPRLLVLDEPTSALDDASAQSVLDVLKTLQEDLDLAMVVISHDLAMVAALAHRLVVLRFGTIVEQGPAASVLANPSHEHTARLVQAYGLNRVFE